MGTKFLISALVFIVAVCVYVGVQPADFHIERSMSINAPSDVVFAQVNDFHQWAAWSPWAKLDPHAVFTYDGPPAGVGSVLHWVGNRRVGTGTATITESNPNENVKIKLEFIAPFAVTNTADFKLKSDGSSTILTWGMDGKNTFISKFFTVFFNMDKKVGNSFEKGLASIKEISETQPVK